jgi:hypothetical protein
MSVALRAVPDPDGLIRPKSSRQSVKEADMIYRPQDVVWSLEGYF